MARRLPQQFAMRRPAKPALRSTAALRKVKEFKVDDYVDRSKLEWQRESYALAGAIGQVGKVHVVTANTVAACEMVPVYLDDTGAERALEDILETDSDDENYNAELAAEAEAVKRVDDAFIGPQGGKRHLLWRAAWHLGLGGESYLVGLPSIDPASVPRVDTPELLWEFLSPLEYRREHTSGEWVRDSTGLGAQTISTDGKLNYAAALGPRARMFEDGYSARFWQQDPAYSELPFCLNKLAIPDMRQYVELRAVIDSAIESRMPAGILLIDESLSFGPDDEPGADDADGDDIDPFTLQLVEHMAAPIRDRSSAASLVPLVLRGDGEMLDKVKLLDLTNENRGLEELRITRAEVLSSILEILDPPPELTKGKATLNHWTGFAVDEEFIGRTVIPRGDAIAAFCTQAFLQAMLEVAEGFAPERSGRWLYHFDPSNITAKADHGVTMIRLWDRDLVSDASTRSANGATEADAPSPEERRERFIVAIVKDDPRFMPLLSLTPMFEGVPPEELARLMDMVKLEAPVDSTGGGDGPPTPGDPSTDDPRSGDGRPETRPGIGDQPSDNADAPDPEPGLADTRLIGMLVGEADAAMERTLERVGNKLISRIDRHKQTAISDRVRARPTTQALALCEPADFTTLGVTPDELLDGEWDKFAQRVEGLVRPWFIDRTGRNGHIAADAARQVSETLVKELTDLALTDRGTTHYDAGLRVPTEMIVTALERVAPVHR